MTTVSSDFSLVRDSRICACRPTGYPDTRVISCALLRWECSRFRSDLHDSILILCSSNTCATFRVKEVLHSASVLITGQLLSAFVAVVSYHSKIECLPVNCREAWPEFRKERVSTIITHTLKYICFIIRGGCWGNIFFVILILKSVKANLHLWAGLR